MKTSYVPGLDGLRALAVLAVIAYHTSPEWFPGGFIGVEVFFVISGFIITRGILAKRAASGSVDLRDFWVRRARRLLPALGALLVGLLSYSIVFEPDEVARLRVDSLAALSYVTNWYLVLDQQSYFDSFERPSLLRHLWSLAVEEQFYVIWPAALALGLRLLTRRVVMAVTIGGAGASAALAAALFAADVDPSRIYYGTDTRAAGFLIGAAFAMALAQVHDAPAELAPMRLSLDVAALAALAVLGFVSLSVDAQDGAMYSGGFLMVSLASVVVISAVLVRDGMVARALSVEPLRWLGARSYGVYLWHWPIVLLVTPQLDVPFGGLVLAAVQIGLTLTIAALSFALVEQPIRRGIRFRESVAGACKPARRLAPYAATIGVVAYVVVLGGAAAQAGSRDVPDYFKLDSVKMGRTPDQIVSGEASPIGPTPTSPAVRDDCDEIRGTPYRSIGERDWYREHCIEPSPSPTPGRIPTSAAVPGGAQPGAPAPPSPAPMPPVTPTSVTAIGDSVMLGAARELVGIGPNVYVDAAVSRQAAAGIAVLRQLAGAGQLGNVVVVHLGNNGTFTAADIDEIMAIAGPERRVLFVTLKVDRPWEGANNSAIASAAARYANAGVVDWKAASAGRPELFWDDGIHVRPAGAALYAQLIASAVGQ